MNEVEKLIKTQAFSEAEALIINKGLSVHDLSDEAFEAFKAWIESPKDH